MKKINKFFNGSDDVVYTLTQEHICNIIKGSVHTAADDAVIFANGPNTSAYADHRNCNVYAAHETACAYAGSAESNAYAIVKGGTAHASTYGSVAHATCLESYAYAINETGAVAYQYKAPEITLTKKK